MTDCAWRGIEPLLPNKPRGVPRIDHQRVLNGISWGLGRLRRTEPIRPPPLITPRTLSGIGGGQPAPGRPAIPALYEHRPYRVGTGTSPA